MTFIPTVLISLLASAPLPEARITIHDAQRPVLRAARELRTRHGWPIHYEDDAMSGGSRYSIDFAYQPTTTKGGPEAALAKLMTAHAKLNMGAMEFKHTPAGTSIVPSYGSILETKVSLVGKRRGLREFVAELCQEVTKVTGIPVVAGRIATDDAEVIPVSADNQMARDVLARVIEQSKKGLVWNLLYIDELEGYVLVIEQVRRISGGTIR